MAVEKNIKEVEATEANFVANAAAKNDGFLTDDTGYPMVKKRGANTDYWYPLKTRDNLGNYAYFPIQLGNGFTLVTTSTTVEIYKDGSPIGCILAEV